MKIYFKVLIANKATAYVTMENQNFLIKEILPLCNSYNISEDATHTKFTLSLDQNIQGCGDGTAGAAALVVLDNTGIIKYYNFQRTTVFKLLAGQLILLPYAIEPAVPVVPSNQSAVCTGATGEVFEVTHWPYVAEKDTDLIGQTSVANCITMDISAQGVIAADNRKKQKDASQKLQAANAIGITKIQAAGALVGNGLAQLQ